MNDQRVVLSEADMERRLEYCRKWLMIHIEDDKKIVAEDLRMVWNDFRLTSGSIDMWEQINATD